eukprot:351879-Chlamydomonas_euryale.AAC.25
MSQHRHQALPSPGGVRRLRACTCFRRPQTCCRSARGCCGSGRGHCSRQSARLRPRAGRSHPHVRTWWQAQSRRARQTWCSRCAAALTGAQQAGPAGSAHATAGTALHPSLRLQSQPRDRQRWPSGFAIASRHTDPAKEGRGKDKELEW